MNKNLKIGLGILGAIVVLTVGAILATRGDDASNSENTSQTDTQQPAPSETVAEPKPEVEVQPDPSAPVASTPGKYVDYSEDEFNNSDDTRLLSFHAPWCPQCVRLDKSIKESEIPAGVTIFKVDFDSNQALRKKYGVTVQTTVVKVGVNGENEGRFVAYDEPTFDSVKRNLLTQ